MLASLDTFKTMPPWQHGSLKSWTSCLMRCLEAISKLQPAELMSDCQATSLATELLFAGALTRPSTPRPYWICTAWSRPQASFSNIISHWLFRWQHASALKADASPRSVPVMAVSVHAGYAQPGLTEDDILLELVMFVGVVCDDATAPQLVQTGLVSLLLCIT